MGPVKGYKIVPGLDIDDPEMDKIESVSRKVTENYKNLFSWYRELSQDRFSGLIRPVHPEYYATMKNPQANKESRITKTVMRIDPFMELHRKTSRREVLSELAGIEPGDVQSWRIFLERIFTLAKENQAVGIKQLQAYSRDLNFCQRTDGEVRFSGDLNENEQRVLKDWIMHECCKLADDLGWPHQVHVGTHNLRHSNPLPLEPLAGQYPNQKLVLLHCWPFLDESGFLAKYKSNIYIDTCWQVILNPDFLRKSFKTWLGYVPANKITMGTDATSIEMAVGASAIAKVILGETLSEFSRQYRVNPEAIKQIAHGFLLGNARDLYTGLPSG